MRIQRHCRRAFFVAAGGARDVGSRCLDTLRNPDFDPVTEILLDGVVSTPTRTPPKAVGEVKILGYAPAEVRLEVAAEGSGYVLLTDAMYPGWQATVDGQPAEIRRADCFFRAVAVSAGRHEVAFRYAPDSVRLGLWVSLISLIGVGAVLFASEVRARRERHDRPWTK
jgi:hypothetical protein